MNTYRSLEEGMLTAAERELDAVACTPSHSARLTVLEAVSSRLGGFALTAYQEAFPADRPRLAMPLGAAAERVARVLSSVAMPPSIALAALARPPLSRAERRRAGAFYTDYRLAAHLADVAAPAVAEGGAVIDPAAGSGTLLAAVVLRSCGEDRVLRAQFIRDRVVAADFSHDAVRAVRLVMASLTNDLDALGSLDVRLLIGDSLLREPDAWPSMHAGHAVVVMNPPWEKLTLTRHEFLVRGGDDRHYGAEYNEAALLGYAVGREESRAYADLVARHYPLVGRGEPDLYKAFLDLAFRLAGAHGAVAAILPAGLIRSKGAQDLREALFARPLDISFQILENRARFFAIDSRFKFVTLLARPTEDGTARLALHHAEGTPAGVTVGPEVRIPVSTLREHRPDLTIPEVANNKEWTLFRHLMVTGHSWGAEDSQWQVRFARELDMTRDRRLFKTAPSADSFPLIEGRMVHQHRCGVKAYHSGTGRRARWLPLPPGQSRIIPQFWVARDELPSGVVQRVTQARVGFCDVSGQTNERTMLASRIPAGVVCGNKVPTIVFGDGTDDLVQYAWLAIVNSLVFDWMLRRVVTTSVNYFALKSIPFPDLAPNSLPVRCLGQLARELAEIDVGDRPFDAWEVARLRAMIEAGVLSAYRLDRSDMHLILTDFPLLDRGQPSLPGEKSSTVTRDWVLLHLERASGADATDEQERVTLARKAGAVPFVSSEVAIPALALAADLASAEV